MLIAPPHSSSLILRQVFLLLLFFSFSVLFSYSYISFLDVEKGLNAWKRFKLVIKNISLYHFDCIQLTKEPGQLHGLSAGDQHIHFFFFFFFSF